MYNITCDATTALAHPRCIENDFFYDMQARVEQKLEVDQIKHFEPIIKDNPRFSRLQHKKKVLRHVPLLVDFFAYPLPVWQDHLTSAVVYALSSNHGRTLKLQNSENMVDFRSQMFKLSFDFFYCLGYDPACLLDDFDQGTSIPSDPTPILPNQPLRISSLPPPSSSQPITSSNTSSASTPPSPMPRTKTTDMPKVVRRSWAWDYFKRIQNDQARECQVCLPSGDICGTIIVRTQTSSTTGMTRHLTKVHDISHPILQSAPTSSPVRSDPIYQLIDELAPTPPQSTTPYLDPVVSGDRPTSHLPDQPPLSSSPPPKSPPPPVPHSLPETQVNQPTIPTPHPLPDRTPECFPSIPSISSITTPAPSLPSETSIDLPPSVLRAQPTAGLTPSPEQASLTHTLPIQIGPAISPVAFPIPLPASPNTLDLDHPTPDIVAEVSFPIPLLTQTIVPEPALPSLTISKVSSPSVPSLSASPPKSPVTWVRSKPKLSSPSAVRPSVLSLKRLKKSPPSSVNSQPQSQLRTHPLSPG
ncbi:hypothetical protein HMI56_006958 [Coelomomyces lativittatus]|nr:hypothetical protein HMI56_006958 [Coelomomyces lativittatus]